MTEEGQEPQASRPPATEPERISIEAFRRLSLRVGVIVSATDHPNADKLLVLSVDTGEGTPRQLVAGIKGAYQATDLVGRQVIVVTNLKPAVLRGVESQGMVLAATSGPDVILCTTEKEAAAGSRVS